MTIDEAVDKLRAMYWSAPEGETAVRVHLFGIECADEIDGLSIREIVRRAGLPLSYVTEVNKGRNLSKYVTINR